ncbi:MAG: hypothetical protein ACREP9_02455, partial [Candidatus Dormibacteraceae bacterium]
MSAVAHSRQSTPSYRDLATDRGEFQLIEMTVEDYLKKLGLYSPSDRAFHMDESLAVEFQRNPIPIEKNPIKRRMFRDLLRGGTVPPVVAYEPKDQDRRWQLIDGIQRSHVTVEVARTLRMIERDEETPSFAAEEIQALEGLQQKPLTLDDFLARPFFVQLWKDLEEDELVRLFMVLNVGQQKVSARHLLEVIHTNLRRMFESWNLKLLTEKEEKLVPRRRGKAKSNAEPSTIPTVTHFRFEYLVDGLKAYVSGDPHVKTSALLGEAVANEEMVSQRIGDRVTEIGSETCKSDFIWACTELNRAIQDTYASNPSWRLAIQNTDNFYIPMMAALGEARAQPGTRGALEDRKAKLIEIIRAGGGGDPLNLTVDSVGLQRILDDVRSNIGRKRRAIIFFAWRQFFRQGIYDANYPLDW